VAGASITRRKQTKKKDEIVSPGPSRGGGGNLGRASRPRARNPKYGGTGATPGGGMSTGLSPGQSQQRRRTRARGRPELLLGAQRCIATTIAF